MQKLKKDNINLDDKQYTRWERFVHFLMLWEGIWAIPLAILGFIFAGWLGYWVFGESFVPYDPAIYMAAVNASGILVMANTAAFLGMYFNFREVWRFYYCNSAEAFRNLPPLTKILIFLGLYCSFVILFIILFIILV